jgi:hypothetical protein
MDNRSLFQSLLSAGRSEQFSSIRSLPGAGVHSQVLRIAGQYLDELKAFFSTLQTADRRCFIKAIAVYKHSVGGLGSVTTLQHLLPLLPDPDHVVLDWILSNTRSYWWYSDGATSFSELQALHRARAIRRAESLRSEEERAAAAQVRRAARATANLYNAVRRGDTKAVAALLNQGASPESTTPEGVALHEYAVSVGQPEIAALLKERSADQNAP